MSEPPTSHLVTEYPADRPLNVRRDLTVLLSGVIAFLAFRLAFLVPGLVEAIYSRGIGPIVVQPLSLLSGLFPVALVEITVVAYVFHVILLLSRAGRDVVRHQRRPSNAFAAGGLRAGRDAGVVIVLFYAMWGFNYARPPLVERLQWPEWNAPATDELAEIAAAAVEATNQAYRDIHHTDDAGEPTLMPADLKGLDRALEQGWREATETLGLSGTHGRRYGRTKRLLLTPIVARFGIRGFYFPWTAEANVLWDSPAVGRPQSMAHEKAHQRGTGSEAEATFLGFVAGTLAPHPHARYSAYVSAQNQVLNMLARADREIFRDIASGMSPGVRRDLEDDARYSARFRGIGRSIGHAMNDRFLRTNRVAGGVLSYGRSVQLLLTYAKQNGGAIVPTP